MRDCSSRRRACRLARHRPKPWRVVGQQRNNDLGWTVNEIPSTLGSVSVRSHLCGHDLHIDRFKGMLGRASAGPKGRCPAATSSRGAPAASDCGSAPSASSPAFIRPGAPPPWDRRAVSSTGAVPLRRGRVIPSGSSFPTTIRGVAGALFHGCCLQPSQGGPKHARYLARSSVQGGS